MSKKQTSPHLVSCLTELESFQHTDGVEGKTGATARKQPARKKDRKRTLVKVAYELIVDKGLEGFRIRQVAQAAGIDNGTLHYHFPNKEALIQSVVEYLVQDLEKNRCEDNFKNETALDELRMEFEDIRLRLHESPEQFIVLSELAIRSWRDAEVAKLFKPLDDGWYAHLTALLNRGIEEGVFRKDLDISLCARAIMVALRGIGYQSRLPPRELDALLSELATQTEVWTKAGPSVELKGTLCS